MHLIKFCVIASFVLLFAPLTVYGADWYNQDWTYAKKITVNSTLVNGTLGNFPILVNITDSDLQLNAANDGSDILFTASNNVTKFNHEIEQYDSSNGWLTAWVQMPVLPHTYDTEFFMYYGDTGSNGEQNNTAATWNDYAIVLHFENGFYDSSGGLYAENHGATITTDDDCIIGSCMSMDGINDYLNLLPESKYDFDVDNKFTFQFWFNQSSTGSPANLEIPFGKRTGYTVTDGYHMELDNTAKDYRIEFSSTSAENAVNWDSGDTPPYTTLTLDKWNMRAWAYGGCGTDHCQYLTSNYTSFNGETNSIVGSPLNDLEMHVSSPDLTFYWFNGLMDEFRVSTVVRTNDWLATEWNNQNVATSSSFLSLGAQGENPNFVYDTIYIRIADEYRNHIGMLTNTDTTTDLDVLATTITVPFSNGTVQFMDSSFEESGEGIACLYDGRVKVSGSLLIQGDAIRTNSFFGIEINNEPIGVQGASGYNRLATQDHSSLHVTGVGECEVGDVITLTTLQEGTDSFTHMVSEGTSMLLVERLGSGSSSGTSTSGDASGHIIQDEGNALIQRDKLDFQGDGVVASDNGVKTVVSINLPTFEDSGHLYDASKFIIFVNDTDGTINAMNTTSGVIDFTNADSTTVIESAMNALTSSRTWKETITILGEHEISSTIDIPSYTKFNIQGKITAANGLDESLIMNVPDSDFIEICCGIIDGNRQNQNAPTIDDSTIDISGLDNFHIHEITLYDGWTAGIRTQHSQFGIIENNRVIGSSDDCIAINEKTNFTAVANNIISGCGYGAKFGAPNGIEMQDGAHDITIIGNVIRSALNNGIEVSTHPTFPSPYNAVITGNTITNTTNGFNLDGEADSKVTNVNIFANTVHDILNSGVATSYAKGNYISGNYFNLTNNAINLFTGTSYNYIQNNFITQSSQAGIQIEAVAHDNYILNNIVVDSGTQGSGQRTAINVLGDDNLIRGNLIQETGNGDTRNGVTLGSGSTGNVVENNYFDDIITRNINNVTANSDGFTTYSNTGNTRSGYWDIGETRTKTLTTDQSLSSSTTLTDVTETILPFSSEDFVGGSNSAQPSGSFLVKFDFRYESPAAADIKVAISPMNNYHTTATWACDGGFETGSNCAGVGNGHFMAATGTGSANQGEMTAYIECCSSNPSGSIRARFAQQTSDVGSTIIFAGSTMTVTRVS